MRVEFTAGADDHDRRLESVLRKLLPHQPLGVLHKALRRGDVRLNGAKASPDSKVQAGDTLAVWAPLVPPPAASNPTQAALPADWVVYEDQDLLVVNKPSGVLVHPGSGAGRQGSDPTLDERVRGYLAGSASPSLSFRPGPLHRLDRETSGLIVFSRTLVGARSFSAAVADRKVTKTYLAVVEGELSGPQEVLDSLNRDSSKRISTVNPQGQEAASRFRPLAIARNLTLVEVDLGTGRTHQIRVHAQTLGHPLAGDLKYGGHRPPEGLERPWFLHAWKLESPLLPPLTASLTPGVQRWLKKIFQFSC